MKNRLRQLRSQFCTPALIDERGYVFAIIDGKVASFPCAASAEFFVRASALMIPLLDELASKDARLESLGAGALIAAEARVRALELALADAQQSMESAHQQVLAAVSARADAEQRARNAARVARSASAVARHATRLQATLDEERLKNGDQR